MRKVDLEQGSPEWLQWRRGLLTATDAAILLGQSPYVTPYHGWQRKLGLIPEQKSTPAMQRGQRDEPVARELFIQEYGINMTPFCVESEKHSFIGSSLDGLSDCGEYILEVKSQRPVESIPDLHMMQMQHQMLSTDKTVKKAFYVSHWQGVNTTFEAYPDQEWMAMYLLKAADFWRRILLSDPPPLTCKDYTNMEAISEWNQLAEEYKKIAEQLKSLEVSKDFIKNQIVSMCSNENCSGSGIKVLKKTISGRIDYKEVLDILNVPDSTIELYRKPKTECWTITVSK